MPSLDAFLDELQKIASLQPVFAGMGAMHRVEKGKQKLEKGKSMAANPYAYMVHGAGH